MTDATVEQGLITFDPTYVDIPERHEQDAANLEDAVGSVTCDETLPQQHSEYDRGSSPSPHAQLDKVAKRYKPLRNRDRGDDENYQSLIGNYDAQVPVPTHAEQVILAKRMEKGDKAARNRLIEGNLGLVARIATKKYQMEGVGSVSFEDIVLAGVIGLIRTVDKFDYRKGCKLSTYADKWIRQAMQREVQNNARTIRRPTHISQQARNVEIARTLLMETMGQEPSLDDIAEFLGYTLDTIEYATDPAKTPISLNQLVGEDEHTERSDVALVEKGSTTAEYTTPEEEIYKVNRLNTIAKALAGIKDPTDRKIIQLSFGFNSENKCYAPSQIATILGLAGQNPTVKQRLEAALEQLLVNDDGGLEAYREE